MSAPNLRQIGDAGVWVDTTHVTAVYLARLPDADEIRIVLAGGSDIPVRRANELTEGDVAALVRDLHPIHDREDPR